MLSEGEHLIHPHWRRSSVAVIATIVMVAALFSPAAGWTNWHAPLKSFNMPNLYVCFEGNTVMNSNRTTVLSVIRNWSDFSTLEFINEGTCDSRSDGNISIYTDDFYDPPYCGGFPAAVGAWVDVPTSGDYNPDGTLGNAYVHVNAQCVREGKYYWQASPIPNNLVDGPSIVAHEVGHALGFWHSNDTDYPNGEANGYSDLMDKVPGTNSDCGGGPSGFLGNRLSKISKDDRDGLWAKYPAYQYWQSGFTIGNNVNCSG